jgi:non-heme chloroperoxidase
LPDEARRREIDVSGKHGRLHCIVQGEGDPLLLLHGALGTGATHFRGQIEEFASTYRVIVPDFLGYGKSQRRPVFDEDFYERDAEDVVALIQHLGLPPVHLCGFSDGAIVAMKVTGTLMADVRSLVLVGGSAILDEHSMDGTRKLAPADVLPRGLQRALARAHGEPYWRQLVVSYVAAAERLYARGNDIALDSLANIDCPTLIVQGELDSSVGIEHAHMLHGSIRGSELEVFTGVGHELHREKPEAFNRRVLRFLSSV